MNYYFFEDSTGWRSDTVSTSLKCAIKTAQDLLKGKKWYQVPQIFIYKVSNKGIEIAEIIDNENE